MTKTLRRYLAGLRRQVAALRASAQIDEAAGRAELAWAKNILAHEIAVALDRAVAARPPDPA